MNYTGGLNVVSCEKCMLSSCLTPQCKEEFFCSVETSTISYDTCNCDYWYDNYGLAVLKQLQDLIRSGWFVGLLILGNSALITTTTTVTVTITVTVTVTTISLTQQVPTAQYVDTMSKNVSLMLATQEIIDRKLEMRVDTFSSVQFSCSVVSDSLRPHESQHARPPCPSPTPGIHSDSRPSSP